MKRYCVNRNKQDTGEHEVHEWTCNKGPEPENKVDLGNSDNCRRALAIALQKGYSPVDGCKFCCEDCHKI